MRAFRFILILAAASLIAFALYSADKSGVSFTSTQFLKTQGVAFLGGVLGMSAILMKGKSEKKG